MFSTIDKENTQEHDETPFCFDYGYPIDSHIRDVSERLDALRANTVPVLSPSATQPTAEPEEPSDAFDRNILDGFSLMSDAAMLPSSHRDPSVPSVPPQLRRTVSAPALLSSQPEATTTVNKNKQNMSPFLSRTRSVLTVPLPHLGKAFRSVSKWLTRPHTDTCGTQGTNRSTTSESSRFLSGATVGKISDKVPASKTTTVAPTKGTPLRCAPDAATAADETPEMSAAALKPRLDVRAASTGNPLKRAVNNQYLALAPPTEELTPKTMTVRPFPDRSTSSERCTKSRKLVHGLPDDEAVEISLADGITSAYASNDDVGSLPSRPRGDGTSFSVPSIFDFHDDGSEPECDRSTESRPVTDAAPPVQIRTQRRAIYAHEGSNQLQRRDQALANAQESHARAMSILEQAVQSHTAAVEAMRSLHGSGTMSKPVNDLVRVKDVTVIKFASNSLPSASFIHTSQFLPLLLWFANWKRITCAAGLSDSQSLRCITNHLTGAAQRLFLENLHVPLAEPSMQALRSRLMTMIPGHEKQCMQETLDLKFEEHN